MFVVAQRCCVYCITILRLNFEHSGVLMYKWILRFACLNAISKLCLNAISNLCPSTEQAYIVSMIIEREIYVTRYCIIIFILNLYKMHHAFTRICDDIVVNFQYNAY